MKDVLKKVIAQNGGMYQMIIAMEEMSELTKELTKNIRGFENRDAIIEELADVHIVLMQLEIIHNIQFDELKARLDKKMERLKERLEHNESV